MKVIIDIDYNMDHFKSY